MTDEAVIDGRQLKAARAILGLSANALAARAGLHRNTVRAIEACHALPARYCAARKMREALESMGIRFGAGNELAMIAFKSGKAPEKNAQGQDAQ